MRRIRIILPVGIFLLLLLIALSHRRRDAPNPPGFIPAGPQSAGVYDDLTCNWRDPVLVEHGRMWIWTLTGSNSHRFLYDIDQRSIRGELTNGEPVLFNGDQSKLLCLGTDPPVTDFRRKVSDFIERISFGKIHFEKGQPQSGNSVESYWMLDLRNNSAWRIRLPQILKSISPRVPSPGFRYAYYKPTPNAREFFVFDLEAGTASRNKTAGEPCGWWDDHNIVIQNGESILLCDVANGEITLLFRAEDFARALCQPGIPHDSLDVAAFSEWNGSGYDIYFTGAFVDQNSGESFLLKAEHAGPSLKLLSRDFKFGYEGHFDASSRLYLYHGQQKGWPNNGVFLRDLDANTTRTLITPDGSGLYSLARFGHDSVIYERSNMVWRIDLNGTNNTRLFPPPGD